MTSIGDSTHTALFMIVTEKMRLAITLPTHAKHPRLTFVRRTPGHQCVGQTTQDRRKLPNMTVSLRFDPDYRR